MPNETKSQSFEADLSRLEEIVRQLESGELPLEASMKLFREGSALAASCSRLLDRAELEITKLTTDENGVLTEVPYENTDAE